jgi:heparan-alpha-glucosaminide N-acetyltransferase
VSDLDAATATGPTALAERRQIWLDGARGTVLAVMLVTPAFGPAESQRWFRHSPWDGLTVSDLVFPAFLFLSGGSLWFLLRNGWTPTIGRRLIRRFIALMVLGLVYNAWDLGADLSTLRVTGVLQTIAVSGGLAAIVLRLTSARPRAVASVATVITIAWSALVFADCERCNPVFWIDQALLADRHLYRQGTLGYDPEGVGQMLAATALVLFGWLATTVLVAARDLRRPAGLLGVFVVAAVLTGLVDDPNKRLGNASYVLAASAAAYALMMLYQRTERYGAARAAQSAFAVLGQNALVVFIGERFINASLARTTVGGEPAHAWITDRLAVSAHMSGVVIGLLVLTTMYAVTLTMKALRWRVVL